VGKVGGVIEERSVPGRNFFEERVLTSAQGVEIQVRRAMTTEMGSLGGTGNDGNSFGKKLFREKRWENIRTAAAGNCFL